jgi:hypothetical protein
MNPKRSGVMSTRNTIISMCLLLGVGIAAGGPAIAQGMMGGTGQDIMREGMMQGGTDHGMMRGGMMGRGMMEGEMMCPMMGGMMQGQLADAGMSSLFGSRVVPKMNLSVDDVRGYLTAQIDRLGNKRLKVGNVNADSAAITAEIVTVDNSLVQRMKIDRGTGGIQYEN